MKKFIAVVLFLLLAFHVQTKAFAWEGRGQIPGTEVTYAELRLTKEGVSVRLENTSHTPVKASFKLSFFDRNGNLIGHSIFGLREIEADSYVNISRNYLNGNLKACEGAYRMTWQKLTYELVY